MDLTEIQSIDSKEIISYKLDEAKKQTQECLVVEDNSLTLNCLNGLPGPLIKWFLKTTGNEGLVRIAKNFGDTGAEAKVIIGYYSSRGKIRFFEGSIKGSVVEARGQGGFGWDPIFLPEGQTKTFGEMSQEEKNEISMRKIAFQKLKEYLKAGE